MGIAGLLPLPYTENKYKEIHVCTYIKAHTRKKEQNIVITLGISLLSWDVSEISKLLILIVHNLIKLHLQECLIRFYNLLLQLCTVRTVLSILVIVQLYTVMSEVCH